MKDYGKEWSFEEMNAYLIKPQVYIKELRWHLQVTKEKDRASVILYMNSKSDAPKPLSAFIFGNYTFGDLGFQPEPKLLIVCHQLRHLSLSSSNW